MIKNSMPFLVIAASLVASPALATSFNTVDLTALEGTQWTAASNPSLPSGDFAVRINFGGSLGMGTIALTTINGGKVIPFVSQGIIDSYSLEYSRTLSSGDTVVADEMGTAVIFTDAIPTNGNNGFMLTFSLDSGNFAAGSLLNVGDLVHNDASGLFVNGQTFFNPGTNFSAPDSVLLPSLNQGTLAASAVSSDASGTTYGNSSLGSTATQAYSLLSDTNSFSVSFLRTSATSKGLGTHTFSFATATANPVPEPATWAMMLGGLGLVGAQMRRRKTTVSFV